jgi:3D (Asp-Asp-Asp) domain-containing protein
MKRIVTILYLAFLSSVAVAAHTRPGPNGPFLATAFAQSGITRCGKVTQRGVVAADVNVLPMGTKILVRNAGPYSGTYTVADTGSKVRGKHIDIYMPDVQKARQFGRQFVEVTVLRWGDGKMRADLRQPFPARFPNRWKSA